MMFGFFFILYNATGENSLEKLVLYVLIKAVKVKGKMQLSRTMQQYIRLHHNKFNTFNKRIEKKSTIQMGIGKFSCILF